MTDWHVMLDQLHATLHRELGRRQLLELELCDALTSLPNRSRFRERLEQALGPGRPAHGSDAVLYLDLDGLKPINDRHGRAVGDEVLRIDAASAPLTVGECA